MSEPLTSETIRDRQRLDAIADDWRDLWRRAPQATPFQSPAWLIAWWEHFSPGDLLVIAIRCGDRLVGLSPFYIETGARGRRVLPLGISVSDYLDVLLDPGADGTEHAIIRAMASASELWDEWEMPDLAPAACAHRLPCPHGFQEDQGVSATSPILALPRSPQELRSALPSRKRRSLTMAHNRAARRGRTEVVAADLSSASWFLADLIRLHQARWQTLGEPGVFADPRVGRFHAAVIPPLLEAGVARLYALTIGGEVAALYYGFVHGQRAYAYLAGFDAKFAFESPGTILIGYAIEQAVREGASEFHFLRGNEGYKYGWGASDCPTTRRVFRRSIDAAA